MKSPFNFDCWGAIQEMTSQFDFLATIYRLPAEIFFVTHRRIIEHDEQPF
jgi:hypothetical protein